MINKAKLVGFAPMPLKVFHFAVPIYQNDDGEFLFQKLTEDAKKIHSFVPLNKGYLLISGEPRDMIKFPLPLQIEAEKDGESIFVIVGINLILAGTIKDLRPHVEIISREGRKNFFDEVKIHFGI